ncbi:conserved hypothetical protein [Ricinus communis]|uniref:Uncharacterized protein n=1 Tax=Ricinus communis TaxID=3988 RepID=B9TNZ4_RICCO|nr:conserved hypothetical protein [Ricinus communis]
MAKPLGSHRCAHRDASSGSGAQRGTVMTLLRCAWPGCAQRGCRAGQAVRRRPGSTGKRRPARRPAGESDPPRAKVR